MNVGRIRNGWKQIVAKAVMHVVCQILQYWVHFTIILDWSDLKQPVVPKISRTEHLI